MPGERTAPSTGFLAGLKARHSARLPKDRDYERMMYTAGTPPTRATMAALVSYLDAERDDATTDGYESLADDTITKLAEVLAGLVWPDPAPLAKAAALLPGWNTVAITTLLHTQIPDYPIFGPAEAQGLRRLGYHVIHEDDPQAACPAYGAAIGALKDLRERARWDQVPESHHFLTRIVQASLAELASEATP